MHGFVCCESAVEAIRRLSARRAWQEARPWPEAARLLPVWGDCVARQGDFKKLAAEVDLASLGIEKRPVDLLVPQSRLRSQGKGAVFHVWSIPVPPGACRLVEPSLVVSGPEFVILQLCGSFARLDAFLDEFVQSIKAQSELLREAGEPSRNLVAEWPHKWEQKRRLVAVTVLACEFAGTYRLGGRDGAARYDCEPVMSARSLRATIDGVYPNAAARRALAVADLMLEGCASPMETALALMLTLPVDFGGFGIKKPLLNVSIAVDEPGDGPRSVKPDFLWAEERLALEYDSAEFHADKGAVLAARNAARSNALVAAGYRVLRVATHNVSTLEGTDLLASQIAKLLDVELATPDEIQMQRRRRLFIELFPGGTDRSA